MRCTLPILIEADGARDGQAHPVCAASTRCCFVAGRAEPLLTAAIHLSGCRSRSRLAMPASPWHDSVFVLATLSPLDRGLLQRPPAVAAS
jgi:hypothetical protein